MTLDQIRDDLYSQCEIRTAAAASPRVVADALYALNAALQVMWLSKISDYWKRERISLSLVASTAGYGIDSKVQRIIGSVRLQSGEILAALDTRSDYDMYNTMCAGNISPSGPVGKPEAYYLERLRSATAGQSFSITLYVSPTPDAAYTLSLDVEKTAPSYSAFGSASVAIPLNYVESILLPIARYYMARSETFQRVKAVSYLERDYGTAMLSLGLDADPQIEQVKEAIAKK